MHWIYLAFAIGLETIATSCLKLSNGFSNILPSVGTVAGYVLSFIFLSFALKTLDISVAYAIWGAFGILLISIIGVLFFHESMSLLKIISIVLIIFGTVGLRLAS